MKFTFHNLGIVKEASIEVNGLTVLTGLNDSGKSFLSKAIYSLVKTISDFESNWDLKKYDFLGTSIAQLFSLYRQSSLVTQEKLNRFNPEIIRSKLIDGIITKKISIDELLVSVGNYSNGLIEDIQSLPPNDSVEITRVRENSLKEIKLLIDRVTKVITDNPGSETKLKSYFDEQIIQGQFQGQINSIAFEGEPLGIIISEGLTDILEVSVVRNKSNVFQINSPLLLRDALVIETPTIIQLERFITNSLAFSRSRQRNDLPPYYLDFVSKIRVGHTTLGAEFVEIYEKIKNIIGGQFIFKNDEGGIVYSKNGVSIRPFNIASGVKSFGILQLLLMNGAINRNSILIVDEPEVHLHPAWVIKYAQILVDLSNVGIPIILSSHSPYLIEAIGKYSKDRGLNDKVKFYFGHKSEDGYSSFNDVTTDLNPIFKALATPMRTLSQLD